MVGGKKKADMQDPRSGAPNIMVQKALKLLVEGQLVPGARITERWFVDRLGITHTQARETLHHLDKLGALALFPRRGAALAKPEDYDPTDLRPVWLALLNLAVDRSADGQRAGSVPSNSPGPDPWENFLLLRETIIALCEGAALPRLAEVLNRLALANWIARRGPGSIDLEALILLARRIAARQFDGIDAAISATFLETTRRFPARREATQLPNMTPASIVGDDATADRLRLYLQRVSQRVMFTLPVAQSPTDQLAAEMLKRIQFGELKPGDPIRELPLANEYGTSRGPVRDALRLLDRRGLVMIEGRRGAFVRSLDTDDVAGLFAIRAVLSGAQMAEAAAAPERPAWIDEELRVGADLLEALAADVNSPVGNYIIARRIVALVTLAAGGNIVIGRLASELEGQVSILWASVLTHQRRLASAATWRKIVESILAGDVQAARHHGSRVVEEAAVEVLRTASNQ